jgi:hypothetical protein
MNNSNVEHELNSLIGLSAGHICYHDIEENSFLHKAVLDAANLMWEHLKSAWILESIDLDGSTSWLSPGKKSIATVTIDGEMSIGPRAGQEEL